MELWQFIGNALAEIVEGVLDAQKKVETTFATIVPRGGRGASGPIGNTPAIMGNGEFLTTVEFDVALTEARGKETAGGIGVFLGTVNLGSRG